MAVRQFLFACVLGVCSCEAAAATADGAQDAVAGAQHPIVDNGPLREGGGDSPDAHDGGVSPGSSSSTGGGDDTRLGNNPAPTAVHHGSRGWQSLLPGSIQ